MENGAFKMLVLEKAQPNWLHGSPLSHLVFLREVSGPNEASTSANVLSPRRHHGPSGFGSPEKLVIRVRVNKRPLILESPRTHYGLDCPKSPGLTETKANDELAPPLAQLPRTF
jgi:hypothetical protein